MIFVMFLISKSIQLFFPPPSVVRKRAISVVVFVWVVNSVIHKTAGQSVDVV